MQITTLTYRRLVSHRGEYGHDALEATAAVPEGADATAVSHELMTFVQQRLGVLADTETLERKRETLTHEVARLAREKEGLKGEVAAVDKLLDKFEALASLAREKGLTTEAHELTVAIDSRIPF